MSLGSITLWRKKPLIIRMKKMMTFARNFEDCLSSSGFARNNAIPLINARKTPIVTAFDIVWMTSDSFLSIFLSFRKLTKIMSV